MLAGRTIAGAMALAATAVTGCGASDGPPPPVVVHVEAGGATFDSAVPAELAIALGSTGEAYQLAIAASGDRGAWSARAYLTRDQVLAAQASLPITRDAGGPSAVRIDGSKPVVAESGTLTFVFGQGQILGSVTDAVPELVDGSFTGELAISCWIPPATPSAGADGSEALVPDPDFASEACFPFRVLLPPS